MTGRVEELVGQTEDALRIKPEWERLVVTTLLNLLRIRHDPQYIQGLDLMQKSAREMQKDGKLESEADVVMNELVIADAFPNLTKPEADELERYFVGFLVRKPESLAVYLAEKLGVEPSDRLNMNNFTDMRMREFIMSRSLADALDPTKAEDFLLRPKPDSPISEEKLFRCIREYCISWGYAIRSGGIPGSVLAGKDKKMLAVVVTITPTDAIMITVNVMEF